jgi:PAS domain S-box-containing protein
MPPAKSSRLALFATAALILATGFWQIQRLTQETDRQLRENLLQSVSSIAETITPELVQSFSFTSQDKRLPAFQRLRSQMAVATEHLGLSWVYTLAQRDGAFVFGPESYPESHPCASEPGTVYRQAPSEVEAAFTLRRPQTTQPYRDEYGEFVSAFVPVLDPRSGVPLLVLGIDVQADVWQESLAQVRQVPLLVMLVLLAMLLVSHLVLEHRHRLPPLMSWQAHYAEAFLCAVVMLTLTVAATWYINASESRARLSTFTSLAQAQAASISKSLWEIQDRLDSLKRLFLASGYVEPGEFSLFTDPFKQEGAVQAYAWIPAVKAADLEAFTQKAREQVAPDYAVWQIDDRCERSEAAGRDVYYPVLHIEPTRGHEAAQGFDLGAERVRRSAIEAALRDKLCTASDPIALFNLTNKPAGIIIFQPVITRQQNGLIAAIIRLDTLVQAPLRKTGRLEGGLVAELFQLDENRKPGCLSAQQHTHEINGAGCWQVLPESPLSLRIPIFCFGKTYAVVVQASPEWLSGHPLREGRVTLFAGFLLTVLLTTLIAFLSNRRTALEREVQCRTADLQQIHDNVRSVLNAAPVAMLVVDAEANIVDANRTAETLFACHLSDLRARKVGHFIGCLNLAGPTSPCGQTPACQACQLNAALKAVLSGAPAVHGQDVQFALGRGDSRKEIWIRFSVEPVQFNNSLHAVAALYDVSAWYRAEAALIHERNLLYALMENLPDRIYFKDTDSRFLKISKAHAASLGINNPEDAVGKTDADFKASEFASKALSDEREIIATGKPLLGRVEHKTGPDGKTRWVSASKAPIRDKEGRVVGLVGISRDITQEIELQQQLQQASKMDAIGRLAGGVAHDFNNLLQAILGFTEILLSGLNERSPQYGDLKQIERAARRAADLTHQLLAFSRKQRIEPQLLDLNQIIASTEKMLCRLMGEEIQIELALDAGIQPILADPNQIEQIIMNLAVNARDAMPKGGRLTFATSDVTLESVDRSVRPEARPGRFTQLSVSDTGSGISQALLDHLFEPFFTTKAQGKGTGLGLSVIYGIVKQNRGWIEVQSGEGQGTSFNIFLPAQKPAAHPAAGPVQKAETISLPGLGKNILLVEDEQGVRSLVSLVLESAGYRVVACENAKAALDVFERDPGRFDLLFSDIVLGGKNGIDLACELREKRPDLPVLLCSGYADERVRWKSIEHEGFRFLAKPFPATTLLATIGEMFIKREKTAENNIL